MQNEIKTLFLRIFLYSSIVIRSKTQPFPPLTKGNFCNRDERAYSFSKEMSLWMSNVLMLP